MLRHFLHRKRTGSARLTGVIVLLASVAQMTGAPVPPEKAPATPREFYNDGTQKMQAGKLRDAETAFQVAVASQNEKIQPAALYNLGEVRFLQGVQQLWSVPGEESLGGRSEGAQKSGAGAIQEADKALAGDDVQALVAAYQRGRGAQRELKAATEAVTRALESYRGVLLKWQRASGDFKSTVELRPTDEDAKNNADVVDRSIAKLVDRIQIMTQGAGGMGKKRSELREKMRQLKKRLPADAGDQMKGPGDDDDEDEDGKPKGPQPGEQEGPSRDGTEQRLSQEEAEQLLGMLRLDSNRKLPLGVGDTETLKPKNRKGRDW